MPNVALHVHEKLLGGRTLGSGRKSGPRGICTLVSVDCTSHTPSHSSGNTRSGGPPPICSHARSKAAGNRLACRSVCCQTLVIG